MEYQVGQTVLYTWNIWVRKWDSKNKKHTQTEKILKGEVEFVGPSPTPGRAIIKCNTPAGPLVKSVLLSAIKASA